MPDFKPSQLDPFARSVVPFLATFGHAESEVFAAMVVFALIHHGDEWKPIGPRPIGEWLRDHTKDNKELMTQWNILMMSRPHPHRLIEEGFCRFVGEGEKDRPIEFTEKGFEALAKWVKA